MITHAKKIRMYEADHNWFGAAVRSAKSEESGSWKRYEHLLSEEQISTCAEVEFQTRVSQYREEFLNRIENARQDRHEQITTRQVRTIFGVERIGMGYRGV